MSITIKLGDITVEVTQKKIKNVHLSVYPPVGNVRISAPSHMSLDTIRAFAITKLDWIKKQQKKVRGQARETPREYIDRESHQVWGERYLLRLVERQGAPSVEVKHNNLVLQVRPGADRAKKQAIVDLWHRQQIKIVVPSLIEKWEPVMDVQVTNFYVRQMKTLWGSCNTKAGSIRLNSELAKKPRECLEYVVVHEMVHLLERSHGQRFIGFMDRFMPLWRHHKDSLNQLPVKHENWVTPPVPPSF
jgi:predicted metal-dependent hydrolase